MKILVVQESDWLKRNPHQQHHLMDRMVLRGHEVKVIDYPIDWPKEDPDGFVFHREVHDNVHKVKPEADIQVSGQVLSRSLDLIMPLCISLTKTRLKSRSRSSSLTSSWGLDF